MPSPRVCFLCALDENLKSLGIFPSTTIVFPLCLHITARFSLPSLSLPFTILFFLISFMRLKRRVKGREGERNIFYLLVNFPNVCKWLAQAEVNCRSPHTWAVFYCLPRHISRLAGHWIRSGAAGNRSSACMGC